MNIDLLSKMVKEMLLDSDKVVLPGLGVFTAEVMPASFSDNGYTVNPPYRRLHFRARDEQDDRLAAMYAVSNGVEMDIAVNIVADFTGELKRILQRNKMVIFPGLGKLRATKENNFFFVPDEDLNIYPEGFGLEPVSLKSHAAEEEIVGEAAGLSMDGFAENDTSGAVSDKKPEDLASPAGNDAVGTAAKSGKEKRENVIMAVLAAVGLLGAVLIAFLVLADACPDFIDSLLYSKEELEIINHPGNF